MRFCKMHGAGNDYVLVDALRDEFPAQPEELARAVSDRHFGIGSDGLIVVSASEEADAKMQIWNPDGSPAEMCGNGLRCVAKLLYERGHVPKLVQQIETGRGVLSVYLHRDRTTNRISQVTVDMMEPILTAAEIPTTLRGNPPVRVALQAGDVVTEVTCVSLGNPHCVLFLPELTDDWVSSLGPEIERHPAFPRRTNVEFVKVHAPDRIQMRVWERGTGETLACGTGACAAVVAGVLTGFTDRQVQVELPGGKLEVHWQPNGRLTLKGPVASVFEGQWPG